MSCRLFMQLKLFQFLIPRSGRGTRLFWNLFLSIKKSTKWDWAKCGMTFLLKKLLLISLSLCFNHFLCTFFHTFLAFFLSVIISPFLFLFLIFLTVHFIFPFSLSLSFFHPLTHDWANVKMLKNRTHFHSVTFPSCQN